MEFAEIVAEVLETDAGEVVDDATPATLGGWTSLRHVQLVVTLEEAYGLSFSREEIRSFKSVGHIREILARKGVGTVTS
ncbi:acyl carrier protein [Streptosporangium sp. KLBMP 9127]|nr:acyl carrier protein [Streptosporangium sp. KLBMP 9127]